MNNIYDKDDISIAIAELESSRHRNGISDTSMVIIKQALEKQIPMKTEYHMEPGTVDEAELDITTDEFWKCPVCGYDDPIDEDYCPKCGQRWIHENKEENEHE